MATFKSDKAQAAVPARYLHTGAVTEVCTYTTSALLSAGDVVQLMKVDPGARVVAIQSKSSDNLAYAIGDGVDSNRYFETASVSTTQNIALANIGYEYTAADTVDLIYASGAALTAQTIQAIVTVTYDGA